MNIENQKVVSITYKLQEKNNSGAVIQLVDKKDPFVFLFGTDQVLPDFETHLISKTAGDSFEFSISSETGYGPVDENAIAKLPRNLFEVEGKLGEIVKIGNFVPLKDQEGNPLQGLVLEIAEEHIKIDFNHPMAGMDLFFSGEVLDVRNATEEEIDHGHESGGHQH